MSAILFWVNSPCAISASKGLGWGTAIAKFRNLPLLGDFELRPYMLQRCNFKGSEFLREVYFLDEFR